MAAKNGHQCSTIKPRAIAGADDRWQVRCAICGPVTEQHHLSDAEAIARRHEEIGGFER